jgi:hypothetical protein
MQILADLDNDSSTISTTNRGSRKRQGVFLVDLDPFLHNLAQLTIYFVFILAVHAAKHQAGASADVTLILFTPLDDFDIAITWFHGRPPQALVPRRAPDTSVIRVATEAVKRY